MLTILLGTDWITNRDAVLNMIAQDVSGEAGNRILIVPELISHDMERRLCAAAGDTASRFAEVLSFTRLYSRVSDAVGHGKEACLDNGGRVVAMAASARQLHSKLKAFAALETKPEFLTSLIDAVDEFKRCCISADDLMAASKQATGTLAQKLEELSLLLHAYDSLCSRGKRDPSDQMTWLLEQLEDSTFARDHVFYIEGFPDFTRQHMAILEHLITNSSNVVISMNADVLDSDNPAFEKAGETAGMLVRFVKRNGIEYRIRRIPGRNDVLKTVRSSLFRGNVEHNSDVANTLQVQQFQTVYEETLASAEIIRKFVQSGARYRDIGVVCSDLKKYQNAVNMTFERCGIPVYQSGTEDILEKTVMITVLSAMEAALNGFEQRDVIRYAKSMLSPLDIELCDLLENYAIMWNINGSRWFHDWQYHPDGLDGQWDDASEEKLIALNHARKQVIEPLYRLFKGFQNAVSVAQQVKCLYSFFEEIDLAQRLLRLAEQFDESGDYRNAQILDQLWDILLSAMEQMYDILGETSWNAETFVRLFRLLLSQYDVGTIPPVLDSVMVGTVSAMRCQQFKHLIVLGVLEGELPGYGGATGVLSDQERVAIRQLGVPLTGGAMDGVRAEFAEIYGVFCGAEETVSVFCPAGQPSYLYRRLYNLVGKSAEIDTSLTNAKADVMEAGAYLSRQNAKAAAEQLSLQDAYYTAQKKKNHTLGTVTREHIEKLYGKSLYLSASQVDKQADCRLSYFLKYGMRAKERKTITIDPAEFGTYVHAVLEQTAREVMARGGFHEVTLEDTLQIAEEYSAQYVQERFSQLDSSRVAYLFHRNFAELMLIVQELWQELKMSEFIPKEFEVAFGDSAQIDAISISGETMDARLRGFVDRVDVWEANGNQYYRVVDYKTGRKDFDYCDVFNGYGLQMLLYLFALEDTEQPFIGDNPIPVGVQYFPARVPVISSDGILSDEEAAAARVKVLKRKGLLLQDEDVLFAMEPAEKPSKMNYTRKKDGSLSGDLATREQMRLLKKYVFALLGKLVDDIASGCVDPNPYTRGGSHNACFYCPYGAVCHPESIEGRRDYKTMTSQRFWEEVEKEMKENG